MGLLIVVVGALAAAWQWTSLNQWARFDTIVAWEQSLKDHPAALYFVAGAYVIGGLVFFPVTVLTVATVFTFGPVVGNVYALVGWILSATVGYSIGRFLGRDLLRARFGSRLDYLQREAERNGLLAVLTVRILPVAPFSLVNLFIGAFHIRFDDFMLGSLLGRIPGLIGLTVFGHQLEKTLRAPALGTFLVLSAVLALIVLANRWLARQFKDPRNPITEPSLGMAAGGDRAPSRLTTGL